MNIFHDRLVGLCVAGTVAGGLFAMPMRAATASEQEVLAPMTAFFAGMARRDAQAITAQTLPGGTMVLMRDGKPAKMTFEEFAARVGKPGKTQDTPKIEERIHDPLIRIDDDLAVVWAPFLFLVDGKVDHCGTDLFNMVRVDEKWLIASVADTGRKNCEVQ